MSLFKGTYEEFVKTLPKNYSIVETRYDPSYKAKLSVTFFKKFRTYVIVDSKKFWLTLYPRFDHYNLTGFGSFDWKHGVGRKNPEYNIISESMYDMDHFGGGSVASILEVRSIYSRYIMAALTGKKEVVDLYLRSMGDY